jgi:hypothetical protein
VITKSIFKGSFGQSIVEIILIVAGVLIALWVDEWRSDVGERKAIQLHLTGIVEEVDSNRWTLHRVRDVGVPRQIAALEYVIDTLEQPDPEIDDPERFIQTLIGSATIRSPWFKQNSFDSFRTSEHYHSSHIQGLAPIISDAYEAPTILYRERFDDRDAYKDAVSQLVPARFQSENNDMRTYTPARFLAPVIADDKPTSQVVAAIINNRAELVQLARYKAERITAKWYAMTRIILEFQTLRDEVVNHPLMHDIEIPVSEDHSDLEGARI